MPGNLREAIGRAVAAWLLRTPSPHTRKAYEHDLNQFLAHAGIAAGAFEHLPQVRPEHVAAALTSNCTAALQLLCNSAFQDLLVNSPRPCTAVVVTHTARDEVGSEGLIRAGSGREYRPGDYLET